jgi:hypothetical protein
MRYKNSPLYQHFHTLRSSFFSPKQKSLTMDDDDDDDDDYNFDHDRRHHHNQRRSSCTKIECIRLVQEFAAKLVLEVFGGGGAIWGFSEVLGLRTTENWTLWRTIAMSIAFLFFIRWSRQLRSKCLFLSSPPSSVDVLDQRIDEKGVRNISIRASKEAGGTTIIAKPTTSSSMRPMKKNVSMSGTRSPIGIQLSSFLSGGKNNTDDSIGHDLFLDEEKGFIQPESSESTALTPPKSLHKTYDIS